MYPAQTSFIPVQVALAKFLENQGCRAVLADYPFWYLGSTPFRYLTGPILPGVLVLTRKLFPGIDFFEVFWGWLGVFWLIGGIGVIKLIGGIGEKKKNVGLLAAIFWLFGPMVPFSFRFSNGLSLMAFSVMPWVLVVYVGLIRQMGQIKEERKIEILFCIMLCFLLFLDISILPNLLLGMVAVWLTTQGWRGTEAKIKKSLKLIACCLLVVTFWYLPGFWWQVLLAPSFAGKQLVKVIAQVGQLLPVSLAIFLAILSGKMVSFKNRLTKFVFYWLFIFGFLTLVRLIADPDFWLDLLTQDHRSRWRKRRQV